MTAFFAFAGEHPFLTFFLAAMLTSTIVRIFRGYPPPGSDE